MCVCLSQICVALCVCLSQIAQDSLMAISLLVFASTEVRHAKKGLHASVPIACPRTVQLLPAHPQSVPAHIACASIHMWRARLRHDAPPPAQSARSAPH